MDLIGSSKIIQKHQIRTNTKISSFKFKFEWKRKNNWRFENGKGWTVFQSFSTDLAIYRITKKKNKQTTNILFKNVKTLMIYAITFYLHCIHFIDSMHSKVRTQPLSAIKASKNISSYWLWMWNLCENNSCHCICHPKFGMNVSIFKSCILKYLFFLQRERIQVCLISTNVSNFFSYLFRMFSDNMYGPKVYSINSWRSV